MVGRRDIESPQPATEEQQANLTAVDALPILLVDDRPENLRALEAVLEPLGYPIATATSGSNALRLLLEHEMGLILLDVRMPGLDGLETARLIKGRARTQDIPIVFLTAGRDEIADVLKGYGVGAVDYVLKPFDPELLRSKVAVFVELEASRRALKRSEAFLRGAFEAAPIGKTVLDGDRRIVRSNPAFARLLGYDVGELHGLEVAELAHEDDSPALLAALDRVGEANFGDEERAPEQVDLRLRRRRGSEVWVEAAVSSIEPSEYAAPMLLVQWIDLTARRRAERARADLLLEQQARAQAEQRAERLRTLQTLSDALESLALDELLEELVLEVAMLFGVDVAGVQIVGERDEPIIVRAVNGQIVRPESSAPPPGITWTEAPLLIERASFGTLRLGLAENRSLSPIQRSLLSEVAERAALAVRRAQLHEEEHRISVELRRGLLPKRLPDVPGIELAAHYQAAGLTAEAGGDWYDAFGLPGGRVGIVVGDVTGRGIPAATTMGQLRSVTRAFALADEGTHTPGEVLTRLNGYQMALAEEQLFTVIYGIIDPQLQVVRWANAGHPPPVLRSATRQTRLLEGGQELMGIGSVVYVDHEQTLRPGDTLILYSDGLVERRGESLDTGLQRLAVAAAEGPEELDALRGHLLVRMLAQVHELHDDVTAMLARMT